MKDSLINRIAASYDRPIIRLYSSIRFVILRERFLEEIGQYLPTSGNVMDIGCGFGLFALYFAARNPSIYIHGIDVNPFRIERARAAAQKLSIVNVHFETGNACDFRASADLQGAYMLDMIHHIPPDAVRSLIEHLVGRLEPRARLVIKDVDSSPAPKMAFTWVLDKLMDPWTPVRYWPKKDVIDLLTSVGLVVHRHALVDILPYPHMIYVGQKIAR